MSKTVDIKKSKASRASKKDDEKRVKEPAPAKNGEIEEEIKEQGRGRIDINLSKDDVPRNGQNIPNSSHQKHESLQNATEIKAAHPPQPDKSNQVQ